jgi:hypothetical protein
MLRRPADCPTTPEGNHDDTATLHAHSLYRRAVHAMHQRDELNLLSALKATVRGCHHGVLIVTECLLGRFTCASSRDRRGVVVMVQPCTIDRRPRGLAHWIGPISDGQDTSTVSSWIARRGWDGGALPYHLRARAHVGDRHTRRN